MLFLPDFLMAIHRFTHPSHFGSEAAFAKTESTTILKTRKNNHEPQKQALDPGGAGRPLRYGRLRAGEVRAEIAGRDSVLRLQGIRGLGRGLFRADRRGAQGDRRQSDHDRGLQGRYSRQRTTFSGWFQDREVQWKPKKSTEAPFAVDVPDVFSQAFVMEKDSQKFPKSGGWGYALFNYEAASDKFTADPSPSDCGHSCHVAVKAKDHIFHPYQKR
jgi:Cytochrome P460